MVLVFDSTTDDNVVPIFFPYCRWNESAGVESSVPTPSIRPVDAGPKVMTFKWNLGIS